MGVHAGSGRYFLILNSDAWAVGDAVEQLLVFADDHPEAAVVGPRLSNPDGTLQRSVRGFPTLWRLAEGALAIMIVVLGLGALWAARRGV